MSDDEVEKFEITDYDLANEFNIHRRTKKQSKNDRIYGIWARDDSSGEESTSTNRAGFRGSRKPKNYTAPIGFVAGGVQQAGKKEEKVKEEEESGSEEDESSRKIKNSSSEESDDGTTNFRGFKPKSEDYFLPDEIAGLRRKTGVDRSVMKKGVGNWEEHTKGIGAKLLLQMGYEPGRGLGKNLQGINAPIEAKLRKGRGAIGAYGPEVSAKIAELTTLDKKPVVEKHSRWRKDDTAANSRVKYVYKSIDEVIQQGHDRPAAKAPSLLSKVKVIDMTGPEQRVLSGYHAISRQQRPGDEWEARKELKFTNFALPELLHNLNLLVEMCEQDIINNDRKYKFASDRIVSLKHETANLDKICQAEAQQIASLERLVCIVDDLTIASEGHTLTLEKAASSFKELQDNYMEEYKLLDMSELAAVLVSSLLKQKLTTWQPLEDPTQPVTLIQQWRLLMDAGESRSTLSSLNKMDPFGKLLWHAWLPAMRTAVTAWNCRKPVQMIRLVEVWLPVIPRWVSDNVLEQLVLPRLTLQVHQWDPMTDTMPIHAWIHPWLPLLSVRLDTVIHPMIRHKLSTALTAWHPSDRSAKLMLLPWHKVFSRSDMDAFLVRNILPKLAQTLDDFIINPQHQVLEEHWRWVMEWEELMPVVSMAGLLEKHFFPKWLQVLSVWLNHAPNYDQVTSWYIGWKSQISETLLKQPNIKDQFRQALDLMNRSAGTGQVPGGMESISYLKNVERENPSQAASSRYQSLQEAVRSGSQSTISGYKALFAKKCEEKDIIFVPMNNKFHEGKQVYRCGGVQVYIDRNVVFVSQNAGVTWTPQSMSSVLDLAEK